MKWMHRNISIIFPYIIITGKKLSYLSYGHFGGGDREKEKCCGYTGDDVTRERKNQI